MAEHEKPRKRLKQLHIREAASGGFIVKHPDANDSLHHDDPNLQHVLGDLDGVHDHLEQHMGKAEEGEEEAESRPGKY